jgi:anti-sigma B factor antagonist
MPGIRNPLIINGLSVVEGPAEIDLTTVEQLRTLLFDSADRGPATIVVDMTRTRFCDSAGFKVLARAHQHALSGGGQLRVVIPADSPVFRVFTLVDLHRLIPWFATLDQAISVPSPWPVTTDRRDG